MREFRSEPDDFDARSTDKRMGKHEQVDDMRLLAIVGSNQIGRLSYTLPGESRTPTRAQIGLHALL